MEIEEVKQKRFEIERKISALEDQYHADLRALQKELRGLYKKCPHKNMNGGSYTRWCEDCGESWDTT